MQTRRMVFVLLLPFAAACGGANPEPESPPAALEEAPDEDWLSDAPAEEPASGQAGDSFASPEPTTSPDEQGATPLGADPVPAAKPLGNTVKETRTTQVIQGVVVRHRQAVRDCYEKELRRSPGLRGTLTIHFRLDPNGNVLLAKINEQRSNLRLPALTLCAVNSIKKIKFPPSSRGFESSINYPFDFRP